MGLPLGGDRDGCRDDARLREPSSRFDDSATRLVDCLDRTWHPRVSAGVPPRNRSDISSPMIGQRGGVSNWIEPVVVSR
jgi:hypothetical protein